jgi:hypothetical protein
VTSSTLIWSAELIGRKAKGINVLIGVSLSRSGIPGPAGAPTPVGPLDLRIGCSWSVAHPLGAAWIAAS